MNHLQSVLLMMLSDIGKLLEDNQIPYFLDGGTALGAVRHKGFIPWDDDIDITILPEHFDRFVEICRTKLDKSKYSFIQGEIDWPISHSKIKLKGTTIQEKDSSENEGTGIFIDIFRLDNARSSKVGKFTQFLLGRIYTACFLSQKPYTTKNKLKKLSLFCGKMIFKFPSLINWLRRQVREQPPSEELSAVWDRSRTDWKKYFCKRSLFREVVYMDFENLKFPVCIGFDEYLRNLYGNYMQLPPIEKQKNTHIQEVDFGEY